MMLKINDKLHGFLVKEKHSLEHLGAELYVMEHEKNGARLIYMDREDENKTFSVSFRTLPSDSTGVFHILEHSVLCGSEKYRLRDPFVELLSGSLNTFLNAMTFKDKTMYPVASTSEKELFNLMDVYLDAVFHPLAVNDKKAFMQEGWHYEINENGELIRNGVVLSEMKGDYSSPESVTDRHIADMLFSKTPYAHDSGGDPFEIVDLTFESFKNAHETWYHPSNAVFFLDGKMDVDRALTVISSYVSNYERRDFSGEKFAFGEPMRKKEVRECEYEISDGESGKDKTRIAIAHLTFRFDDRKNIFGTAILASALFTSNESPIKKIILASELCEDMQINVGEGIYNNYFEVDFINIKDGKCDELKSLFYDSIKKICDTGIDRSHLVASINSIEFFQRERDYGSLPLGIIYAMTLMESYLYSDDAISAISFEEEIAFLRGSLDGRFFEELLEKIFITNESRAELIMHPSTELGQKEAEKEKMRLLEIQNSLTDSELEMIKNEQKQLREWQEAEESAEAKASIPRLSSADIPREISVIPTDIKVLNGVEVIYHPIATNKITYTELYFNVSDLSQREIFIASLLGLMLGNLETENYSAPELLKRLKSELGSISGALRFATRVDGTPTIHFKIFISCLNGARASAIDLCREVFTKTRFCDLDSMRSIIKQAYIASEESFASAGHRIAKARVAAMLYPEAAAKEYYSGYEAHRSLKALISEDTDLEPIANELSAFIKKYLRRERMTVSLTCDSDTSTEKYAYEVTEIFDRSEKSVNPVCNISPLPKRNEGIRIAAKVAFSSRGMNILRPGERVHGSFEVASNLANYEYLWSEIRVKGGAYGAGMSAARTGLVSFYSYRDPSPKNTVEVFAGVSDFLLDASRSSRQIDKYIIGAIGETTPYLSARAKGNVATSRYLNGLTDDMRRRTRAEILSTTLPDLELFARMIEARTDEAPFVVVAPDRILKEVDGIDEILDV